MKRSLYSGRRAAPLPRPLRARRRAALSTALLLAALSLGLGGARCVLHGPHFVPVASGLDGPVYLTAPAGDPRLFVVELGGRIRIIDADGNLLADPFLDISHRVNPGGERGLLGLAFSPEFATDDEFYVYYTARNGDSVVSRVLVGGQPNRAVPSSEWELLRIRQPAANHNGGTIAFSPVDGMLYAAFGDGGGGNDPFDHGQNPDTLLGKMLRVDVGGNQPGIKNPRRAIVIPPDNPYAAAGDGVRDEIWAFGLRNPYRFGFDRDTGDLWIADVGQDAREEVNVELAGSAGGLNYGWPVHEGSLCHIPDVARGLGCESPASPALFTFPVAEYGHGLGCSITGGTPYRGAGTWLGGWYFFADYCSSRIWMRSPHDGTVVDMTNILGPPGGLGNVSGFGEDGFGELHVVNLAGNIYRLKTGADADGDGILTMVDNCPDHWNRDQADGDGNGVGDACEVFS